MALFSGTAGADNLVGAVGVADVFRFGPGTLQGTDTVDGGGGAGIDLLDLTFAGSVLASSLAGVAGIERIKLSALGQTDLDLDAGFLARNGAGLTILGAATAGNVRFLSTSEVTAITYLATGAGASLISGAGDDLFQVSAAASGQLNDGDDILRLMAAAASGSVVDGGAGIDMIEITGAGAHDLSAMTGFEEVAMTRAATVTMSATTGQRLEGSVGNDVVFLGVGGQSVFADLGNDVVHVTAATLAGSFLSGGGQSTRDTLVMEGPAFSTFDLRRGAAVTGFERIVLDKSATNSLVILGNGAVDVVMRTGATVTMGNHAAQTVFGSRIGDTVTMVAAGQAVDTGAGSDTVFVSIADVLAGSLVNGGLGSDTVVLTGGGSIDLQFVAVFGFESIHLSAQTSLVSGGQSVIGSFFADRITLATRASIVIDAGSGNDTLRAAVAGCTINGGSGADEIQISAETDQAIWAAGGMVINGGFDPFELDVLSFQSPNGTNSFDLRQHTINSIDRLFFGPEFTRPVLNVILSDAMLATADGNNGGSAGDLNIDGAIGSDGSHTLDGSALTGTRLIRFNLSGTGFGGQDLVVGGSGTGADYIDGGAGNDTLVGNGGADNLIGGSGTDSLNGGEGADLLTGGAGGDVINLIEAAAVQDTIRFNTSLDGSGDINTIATEALADHVIGFDPALDRITLSRAGLGLGSGGVASIGANAPWNMGAGVVFAFDSLDTITANNFGDLAQVAAGINVDTGTASGSSVGRTIVFAISNQEANLVRRTGLYVWSDIDGDAFLEASDNLHLLAVLDGITASQLTASNFLLV